MQICEIYSSIQGEGLLTGTPSTFVRTSGCNLRCDFCDTPFASWNPEGASQSIAEILRQIEELDPRHVVLTGGEPMIAPDVVELCKEIRKARYHLTIETAGTVFKRVGCDLMSISPKMSNSTPTVARAGNWSARHERDRLRPHIVNQLVEQAGSNYQIKFVIDTLDDAFEALEYIEELNAMDRSRVLFMPQGITVAEIDSVSLWLLEWCKQHGFRFCDRAQLRWFGNERGT